MSPIELTPVQRQVLEHAAAHVDGLVEWFPDHVKGGARQRVLEGLNKRELIAVDGADWFITDAGYQALGRARPVRGPAVPDPELESVVTAAEARWQQDAPAPADPPRRTRNNTKQAQVIQMLQRPEGATVSQIVEATGWQAHTVRGTFAGTFKKKLGLNLVSDKPQGGERVYRVV